MNKKIISIILTVVMVMSLCSVVSFAAAGSDGSFAFSADKTELAVGDEVTVTLTADAITPMGSLTSYIAWPTGLTFKSSDISNAKDYYSMPSFSKTSGKFGLAVTEEGFEGELDVLTIVFTVEGAFNGGEIAIGKAKGTYDGSVKATPVTGSGTLDYGTVEPLVLTLKSAAPAITKLEKPVADATEFVYDGTAKTYTIVANDAYTVTGATQTNAGEYKVTVALNDKAAYAWADDSTDDLEYSFVIKKAAGSIAIDGNLNVTEGTEVPDVTVNAAGDGAVTVYYYTNEACTEGETTTKPTAVGNYWAKAKVAASANYEAAESNVIAFAIADSYIEMNYNKAYSYKLDGNTLNVKGADATIFVIEATYDGNKMTSCKLTPVVITGGVGSCAVSGTFFIWDANMQAMN